MNKLIYIIIVICFLDLFIQLPIITPYALSIGGNEYEAGIVVAIYSLFNMFGNIIGGYFADKIGRKKLLVIGMLSQVLILFSYTIIPSISVLMIVRVLHGLSSGVLTPAAFSVVSDVSKKARIGQSMALTGVAIGLSAVLGPALGGIISSIWSYQAVYIFISGVFIVGLVLLLMTVTESSTVDSRDNHYSTNFWQLMKRPTLIIAYISAFSLMISNGTLAYGLPFKTEVLGLMDKDTGMMLSVFGITAIIIFASPLKRIYSIFDAKKLVILGITIIATAMILLHISSSVIFTYVTMVIYGSGFALVFPSMNKIIGEYTDMHERGKTNGLFYAFFSLGSVVGSYLSGILTTYYQFPFSFIGIILFFLVITIIIIQFLVLKKEVKL